MDNLVYPTTDARKNKIMDTSNFHYTRQHFGSENIELFCGKLPYAYNFAKDVSDYYKTKFPDKQDYDDDLKEEECTDSEFERVKKVREVMGCKIYKDEHDVYLHLDVLLLADVFEFFRMKSHSITGLDPAWFISLPGYSWTFMLKTLHKNDTKVELLTDIDMHLMIESAIHGGLCMVNKRLCQANNIDTHLLYIDATNLYGWCMCEPLPVGEFSWCDVSDMTMEKVMQLDLYDEYGFFFPINGDIPDRFHDYLSDLLICPETRHFNPSPYMQELAKKCNISYIKRL